MARLELSLTDGVSELSSRLAVKMLFTQFGEVAACWLPPIDARGKEFAYVRFNTETAAEAAMEAAQSGQLYLDGVRLKAEWRAQEGEHRSSDAQDHDRQPVHSSIVRSRNNRDFDAKGSNLETSRELMLREQKARQAAGGGQRKKKRSRSRKRKRSHSRSRSRSRKSRKRDRRKKSKKDDSSAS
eukprot:CAMPEP_0178443272 /NCGR_PEP_ID=MMETSP0689_2-20121128/38775_1 /TAXON_ID=160604 /ORGANISM="Amphidinium massartii, Strain CS-259" /LENGTH=183 /DNA_ID=CAMNT_0020067205 /DNA_START=60 /DNA_END=608 /DNA_ORIENTATION=+